MVFLVGLFVILLLLILHLVLLVMVLVVLVVVMILAILTASFIRINLSNRLTLLWVHILLFQLQDDWLCLIVVQKVQEIIRLFQGFINRLVNHGVLHFEVLRTRLLDTGHRMDLLFVGFILKVYLLLDHLRNALRGVLWHICITKFPLNFLGDVLPSDTLF